MSTCLQCVRNEGTETMLKGGLRRVARRAAQTNDPKDIAAIVLAKQRIAEHQQNMVDHEVWHSESA